MAKGPKGERRPDDPAQAAILAVRIALGEAAEELGAAPSTAKNPAAVTLGSLGGRKGGKARAAALSKERRREIAQRAAKARWGDDRK
jgi:hypothetical protein